MYRSGNFYQIMSIDVKFSIDEHSLMLTRQIPSIGCDWTYSINDPNHRECDVWVVFENLPPQETLKVTCAYAVHFAGEPSSVKGYSRFFLGQFDVLVTSHLGIQHPHIIYRQTGLPWLYDYDFKRSQGASLIELSAERPMQAKKPVLSVICSDKQVTPMQRARLHFIEKLSRALPEQVHVYGRGFKEIANKATAIKPYQFHLAMENCVAPDYWSEKLADAFLGWAMPLYAGCPNLDKYFPHGSYVLLDLDDIEGSISMIRSALNATFYTNALPHIEEARRRLLTEYNFFEEVIRLCATLPVKKRRKASLLTQEQLRKWHHKFEQAAHQVYSLLIR